MSSTNRIALVTGAGSGIGRAVASALEKEGYTVVLAGRRAETLNETIAQSEGERDRFLPVPTDISDSSSVAHLFQTIEDKFGRIDLLFNNAGTNVPAVPIDELTLEQWQQVVDINLTGTFLCTQAAVKLMKMQEPMGGRIINNGSISASVPRPNSAPYTATKHAVSGLTKSTSLDGRPFNIACGQIDIGNAETPMAARMKKGVPQANGEIKPEPTFDTAIVADSVVHMANLPLDANVLFMTVMATNMPFTGRG